MKKNPLLRRLLDLGVAPETTPADARCVRLVNAIALLGLLICTGVLPFQLTSFRNDGAMLVIAFASFAFVLTLNFVGRTFAAGLLLCIAALTTTAGQVLMLGLEPGLHYYLLFLAFCPYFVFPRARIALALGLSLATGLTFIAFIWAANSFPRVHFHFADFIYHLSMVAVMAPVIGGYARALALGAESEIAHKRRANEALLREVLPERIAAQLLAGRPNTIAVHDEAVIVYADIVGFTPLAESMAPEQIVELLEELVSEFDTVCARHNVEKLKILGDAFIAAAGLSDRTPDAATRALAAAVGLLAASQAVCTRRGLAFKLRVGVACGTVAVGIVGKHRFNLDVWGEALIRAEALQRDGLPGFIVVDEATRARARGFEFLPHEGGYFRVDEHAGGGA